MTPKRSEDLRILAWIALAIFIGYLVSLLRPILTPFLVAAMLAYVSRPAVVRLVSYKVYPTLASTVVLLLVISLFAGLVLITVPLLEREFSVLMERLPKDLERLRQHLGPWLSKRLGIHLRLDGSAIDQAITGNIKAAGGWMLSLLPSIKIGGLAVLEFAINLLLVPVVAFYFLRDWEILLARVEENVPRRWLPQVVQLAREIDQVLGQFLRGQLLVMLLMAIYYSVGLLIVGLEFAVPIGLVSGLLVFIPYLGAITGLLLGTMAAFLQYDSLGDMLPVWIVFFSGQSLEAWVVTPWLVGERIGLHPIAVIFALMAFGQLFGFFGVLLALPASAALLVWLRQVRRQYLQSDLYQK